MSANYHDKLGKNGVSEKRSVLHRQTTVGDTQAALARQNLGTSGKKTSLSHGGTSQYASIFQNRKALLQNQTRFMGDVWIKKDADMAKNRVETKYDYAIIKIQKWFKRRKFHNMLAKMTSQGGRYSKGIPDSSDANI